ncbi:MAG: ATP-binding cassette domain-containing protein [Methylibium sp.]|nr:ATP-binding cassette domain-containing protein [Methylibium sp.]
MAAGPARLCGDRALRAAARRDGVRARTQRLRQEHAAVAGGRRLDGRRGHCSPARQRLASALAGAARPPARRSRRLRLPAVQPAAVSLGARHVLLPCRFSTRRATRSTESGVAAAQTASRLLERLGLDAALCRRSASELSVGQQQRVAAARALVGRPELVIADEPTSALDEALRESFMRLLLGACADAGSALLFVSHDARLAPQFDRQVDLPTLNRATAAEASA